MSDTGSVPAGARGAAGGESFGEVRPDRPGSSGSDASPPASERRPTPALWALYGVPVLGVMGNTLFAPAEPNIKAALDITSGQIGVLQAATTFPGIVLAPVIGLLADRYGRRDVLVPCMFFYALFGVLGALAPNYTTLLVLRLLLGVAGAGALSLPIVVIADHWHGRERAQRIGWFSAAITVSVAVMPIIGGVLTAVAGWRATFLPYLAGFVVAAALWQTIPVSIRHQVAVGAQVRTGLAELRKAPILVAMAVGAAAFFLIFGTFYTALPIYAHDEFGLDSLGRGLLLGFPAIGSTAMALLAGRLHVRFGSRRLLLGSFGLFAMAFVGIGLAPIVAVAFAASLFYGAAEGLMLPATQHVVTSWSSDRSRGMVVALNAGAGRIGQTIGPVAVGASLGALGGRTTLLASAGFAVAALIALAFSGQPEEAPDPVPVASGP